MSAVANTPVSPRRLLVLRVAAVAVAGLLLGRLYYIQFDRGPELRTQAAANRFVPREIEADRGVIYDSKGNQVVLNRPRFTVSVVTSALPQDPAALKSELSRLAAALDLSVTPRTTRAASKAPEDASGLEAAASAHTTQRSLQEVLPYDHGTLIRTWRDTPLARNVPRDAAFTLMESSWEMPGVLVGEAPVREYPAGPTLAQILGFTGGIPPERLPDYLAKGYAMYDVVGQSGLEATYEDQMRGAKGEKLIEVDAAGRELRTMGEVRAPVPGHSLVLGIDLAFQQRVEEILADALRKAGSKSGAVVALDPRDGTVRALVSLPTFDNNMFSTGASPEEFAAVLSDEGRPLLNRAISGQYPPGSTFKMITAAAGLADGVITTNTRIADPGVIVLPNQYDPNITYPFYCWLRSGHGSLNVVGAIANSCDVFFYEVAGGYHENGADQPGLGSALLGQYARAFGLGSPTGIELLGEASGRVPTAEWLSDYSGLTWTTGETYNFGIGQSYLLVTPLQMAVAVSTVANGGTVYEPHLVARIVDSEGNTVDTPGGVLGHVPVSAEDLAAVREGMRQAVTSGTANPAWTHLPTEVSVAGKTGTAEFADPVFTENGAYPRRDKDGNLLTHAWFVSFAPYENPEIALAVFIDGSGMDHIIEGSEVAAPVAADVLRAYFGLPATSQKPCVGCAPPEGGEGFPAGAATPETDAASQGGLAPAGADAGAQDTAAGNTAPGSGPVAPTP